MKTVDQRSAWCDRVIFSTLSLLNVWTDERDKQSAAKYAVLKAEEMYCYGPTKIIGLHKLLSN